MRRLTHNVHHGRREWNPLEKSSRDLLWTFIPTWLLTWQLTTIRQLSFCVIYAWEIRREPRRSAAFLTELKSTCVVTFNWTFSIPSQIFTYVPASMTCEIYKIVTCSTETFNLGLEKSLTLSVSYTFDGRIRWITLNNREHMQSWSNAGRFKVANEQSLLSDASICNFPQELSREPCWKSTKQIQSQVSVNVVSRVFKQMPEELYSVVWSGEISRLHNCELILYFLFPFLLFSLEKHLANNSREQEQEWDGWWAPCNFFKRFSLVKHT